VHPLYLQASKQIGLRRLAAMVAYQTALSVAGRESVTVGLVGAHVTVLVQLRRVA